MVPIFDEATQRVKALSVLGEDGRQFVVTVDPKLPSRLLVQDRSTSKLYVLQVRLSLGESRLLYSPQHYADRQRLPALCL